MLPNKWVHGFYAGKGELTLYGMSYCFNVGIMIASNNYVGEILWETVEKKALFNSTLKWKYLVFKLPIILNTKKRLLLHSTYNQSEQSSFYFDKNRVATSASGNKINTPFSFSGICIIALSYHFLHKLNCL